MFRSIFEEDPFFQDPFQDMHSMMGFPQRSYTSMGRRQTEPTMALSPMGMLSPMGFGGMFSGMDSMMRNMQSSMQMMHPGNSQMPGSFQSSYTSISYGGNGSQPQVYQSSSSTKVGPNGVKETRKSERNSSTGLNKMAIGHHIGERAHIVEKAHNSKTGEKEESQEFVQIEEEEAEKFDKEFQQRVNSAPQGHSHRSVAYHQGRHQPYRHHHQQRRAPPAAIEYHHHVHPVELQSRRTYEQQRRGY